MIKPLHGAPRKVWQITHIVSAVGWLGIVVCVLGLTLIGLSSDDAGTVRTAHDAAALLAEMFFLPATLLMFISGVILALGTKWGLVKHYWVLVKLVIGCALLVAGTITLGDAVADMATDNAAGTVAEGDGISLAGMLSVIAGISLFSAILSVAKPWGRTRWGRVQATRAAKHTVTQES
jgi:nucleoside recognition membrane protein YjiH